MQRSHGRSLASDDDDAPEVVRSPADGPGLPGCPIAQWPAGEPQPARTLQGPALAQACRWQGRPRPRPRLSRRRSAGSAAPALTGKWGTGRTAAWACAGARLAQRTEKNGPEVGHVHRQLASLPFEMKIGPIERYVRVRISYAARAALKFDSALGSEFWSG